MAKKKKTAEEEVRESGIASARAAWKRLITEGEISGLWQDPAFFEHRSRQNAAMIAQAAEGKTPWFMRVKGQPIQMPPKPEEFELLAKVWRDVYRGELQRLIGDYMPQSPIEQQGIETAIKTLNL